jgi:hypothetical protein
MITPLRRKGVCRRDFTTQKLSGETVAIQVDHAANASWQQVLIVDTLEVSGCVGGDCKGWRQEQKKRKKDANAGTPTYTRCDAAFRGVGAQSRY